MLHYQSCVENAEKYECGTNCTQDIPMYLGIRTYANIEVGLLFMANRFSTIILSEV